MRRLMRHKWVIPVAALVLAMGLGAVALAAGGTPDSSAGADGSAVITPAGGSDVTTAAQGGLAGRSLKGVLQKFKTELHGLTPGTQAFRDKVRELTGALRDKRQARLDGITKLVRDKMTPAQQQELDSLLEQSKTQRGALQKARQSLGETVKHLRDLMDKYLDPSGGGGGAAAASS
jgi:hypothetical protein